MASRSHSALTGGLDAGKDGAKARERVGYLAQEFAGYDWPVQDAMEFICEVRGADPSRIPELLALCGLTGQERKAVPALSGGMKQKLALAQALVGDPEILLLDEPCSSLDLKSRRELLAVLAKLKGTRTIVMTSHHVEEVEALAERVLWLDEAAPARMVRPESFLAAVEDSPELRARAWVRDFHGGAWLRLPEAYVVRIEGLATPMGTGWVAFSRRAAAEAFARSRGGG